MEFIDLQRQYRELEKEINEGIKNVLEHGKYIMGPEVQQLEKELCDYTGSKYGLTCANGTDALQKKPPVTIEYTLPVKKNGKQVSSEKNTAALSRITCRR